MAKISAYVRVGLSSKIASANGREMTRCDKKIGVYCYQLINSLILYWLASTGWFLNLRVSGS